MRKLFDALCILTFACMIAIPAVGMLAGWGKPFDPLIEGRMPMPAPHVEMRPRGPIQTPRLSSLTALPTSIEQYFNDRHYLRPELVKVHLWGRLHHLTTATQEVPAATPKHSISSSNVSIGKDGWLFYSADKSIEGYRRVSPFNWETLEMLRLQFESRQKMLAAKGIAYLLVIGPNKGTIYPEYLPDYVQPLDRPSRFDQLKEHLERHSTVRLVDLRPALRDAKKQQQVYYKTDSHWNQLGAEVACREILEAAHHPGAGRESWEQYQLISGINAFTDERRMLQNLPPVEQTVNLEPLRARTAVFANDHATWWSTHANRSRNASAGQSRALVVHDSFFVGVAPFFSEYYGEVRYFITNSLPIEAIDEFRPDLVIDSWVERVLYNLGP